MKMKLRSGKKMVVRLLALGLMVTMLPAALKADSLKVTITNVTLGTSATLTDGTADGLGEYGVSLVDLTIGNPLSALYDISGSANPPGNTLFNPTSFLSTTEARITNTSTTDTYHFIVEFIAETFTYPATGSVVVGTQINTNDASGLGVGPSSLTTAATGGLPFLRTESFGHNDAGLMSTGLVKAGPYTLTQVYDVFVKAGGTVKAQLRMEVTPAVNTPEPWNVLSVIATAIPVGLFYFGRKRTGK
jgi:hypothetical protein